MKKIILTLSFLVFNSLITGCQGEKVDIEYYDPPATPSPNPSQTPQDPSQKKTNPSEQTLTISRAQLTWNKAIDSINLLSEKTVIIPEGDIENCKIDFSLIESIKEALTINIVQNQPDNDLKVADLKVENNQVSFTLLGLSHLLKQNIVKIELKLEIVTGGRKTEVPLTLKTRPKFLVINLSQTKLKRVEKVNEVEMAEVMELSFTNPMPEPLLLRFPPRIEAFIEDSGVQLTAIRKNVDIKGATLYSGTQSQAYSIKFDRGYISAGNIKSIVVKPQETIKIPLYYSDPSFVTAYKIATTSINFSQIFQEPLCTEPLISCRGEMSWNGDLEHDYGDPGQKISPVVRGCQLGHLECCFKVYESGLVTCKAGWEMLNCKTKNIFTTGKKTNSVSLKFKEGVFPIDIFYANESERNKKDSTVQFPVVIDSWQISNN